MKEAHIGPDSVVPAIKLERQTENKKTRKYYVIATVERAKENEERVQRYTTTKFSKNNKKCS